MNPISALYAGLSGAQPTRPQATLPRTRTLGSLRAQQTKQTHQQSKHQARKQADDHSEAGEKSLFESRFESSFDEDSVTRRY